MPNSLLRVVQGISQYRTYQQPLDVFSLVMSMRDRGDLDRRRMVPVEDISDVD